MDELLEELGDIPVITDQNSVRRRSRDFYWYSPILKPQLDACFGDVVVMPRNEQEVIDVVRRCYARDIPVTVRGGGTGNYGQAVPLKGGVILEVRGLDAIEWMRPGRVRTGPGIRVEALEKVCRAEVRGELRMFPSTIRHATIGGYIAGGSSGIGSVTWGLLRDWGNLVAARVVTMESEPRVIELRGADVQQVNHAYGTNGVITALELPLAPAVDWVDLLVATSDFMTAMHFARQISEQPGIQKRLVSLVAAPTPQRHFEALGKGLGEGDHAVLLIVAREDVETVEAFAAGAGNVDDPDPGLPQLLHHAARQAEADFLHRHGNAAARDRLDRGQHAAPVGITAGLDRFLQRVEMDIKGIGLDHVHRPAGELGAVGAADLGGAQIGQQRHLAGFFAQVPVEPAGAAIFQRHPLRADGKGDAELGGGLGEVEIDLLGPGGAAGH